MTTTASTAVVVYDPAWSILNNMLRWLSSSAAPARPPTVRCDRARVSLECHATYIVSSCCPTICTTVLFMAQRDKRSVSFPPDLAKAIDEAAASSGTTFSAWIAQTASRRLRLEAGRQGVAEWEAEHGPLSKKELAEGLARARELLGRPGSKRSA